jgi:hypothetical protein
MASNTILIDPAFAPADPALRTHHRVLAVAVCVVAAVCVGWGAWWLAVLAAIPIVIVLAMSRPEVLLVLFITAGLYKQDPRIVGIVPFDLTIGLGALLAITLLPRLGRTHVPRQCILLLPLFVVVAWGMFSPANAYGAEKAMLFCTLTALTTAASIVVIDSPRRMQRFLITLAVVGFVISVDAVRHQDTTSWGRLSVNGANPIALGRIGAIAFAFAWIRFHFASTPIERLMMMAVLGFSTICTLASGSRGPVVSTMFSLALISCVTYAAHRRMPIALGPLLAFGLLALVIFSLASGPEIPVHRFELLLSENKGTSILVRGYMFVTAWQLTVANPFGIGIGGFEAYAPLDLVYPHNLLLEVGCELGWAPLLTLVGLLAWSFWTMIQILRREYAWHTVFLCLVLSSALMNAMVTGDLNDNRLLYATLLLPFMYRSFRTVD